MLPGLDKHVATLAYHIRENNVEQFLHYYDTELNNLTQTQVFIPSILPILGSRGQGDPRPFMFRTLEFSRILKVNLPDWIN